MTLLRVVFGTLYGYSVYICARRLIVCAVSAFLPIGGRPYGREIKKGLERKSADDAANGSRKSRCGATKPQQFGFCST